MYRSPKIVSKKGAILATCGDTELGVLFYQWWGTRRKKPEFPEKADFEAVVLDKNGKLWHYDETLTPAEILEPFFSIGTGAHAALGALHAGASPEQAVEIACKIDNNSGLPVQIIKRAT